MLKTIAQLARKHQYYSLGHPRKVHPKILGPLDPEDPPQTSPLLRLPPVIRRMIWSYALTSDDAVLIYCKPRRRFYTDYDQHPKGVKYRPSLIITCHEICLETLYLPLKLNNLIFPTTTGFWDFYSSVQRKEGALGMALDIPKIFVRRGADDVWAVLRVSKLPKESELDPEAKYWVLE